MTVSAHLSIGIEVIEDAEALSEGMKVRCVIPGEQGERRIVVACRLIAEDLIVGAVFLHDVDHMLNR